MKWFSRVSGSYWKIQKNQIDFLSEFATMHGIKQPKDWGNVTQKQVRVKLVLVSLTRLKIIEAGGATLIGNFGANLRKMLQSVFPSFASKKSSNF